MKSIRLKFNPFSLFLLLAITLGLWMLPDKRPSHAQVCANPRGCFTDTFNTCIPSPTSLPALNIHAAGDWYTEELNGHCGAKRFLYLFAKPCGPPLAWRLCTSSEKNSL